MEVKDNHRVLFWVCMLAKNHHIQCRTLPLHLDLVISFKVRTTRITLSRPLRGKITIMLKIKKFSNPFLRSIRHTMHKKSLTFALVVEVAKLNFTYIAVSWAWV